MSKIKRYSTYARVSPRGYSATAESYPDKKGQWVKYSDLINIAPKVGKPNEAGMYIFVKGGVNHAAQILDFGVMLVHIQSLDIHNEILSVFNNLETSKGDWYGPIDIGKLIA